MQNRHKRSIATWLATVASLFILYVASAPPVIMSIAQHRGSLAPYQPIIRVLESDYNGPLLWYFNKVWHCGVELDRGHRNRDDDRSSISQTTILED
jgi:hypothetical protein